MAESNHGPVCQQAAAMFVTCVYNVLIYNVTWSIHGLNHASLCPKHCDGYSTS